MGWQGSTKSLILAVRSSAVRLGVVQQQFLHFPNACTGLGAGTSKITTGVSPEGFANSIQQRLFLFRKHHQNLVFDEMANGHAAQPILACFSKRTLNNFFYEKTLDFPTAKKAFQGVDRAIHKGAFHLCRLVGELEFPLKVATLPTLLMQAWHDHLRKAVNGDFVGPLGYFFAPRFTVVGELFFNLFTDDMMPPVVAMAKAIWTVEGRQGH